MKKKRGRAKASSDASKQEAALDSQGEESPKEVVSRSGRKIKPKRFADFSSSDETETITGKNDIYMFLFVFHIFHRKSFFDFVTSYIHKILKFLFNN